MYSRFDGKNGVCNRNGHSIKTTGSTTAELYHFGVKGMKWRKRTKKIKDKINNDDSPSFGNDVIRLQENRKKYLSNNPVSKSKAIFNKAKKSTANKITQGANNSSAALEKAKSDAKQKTFDRIKSGQKAYTSSNLMKNKLKSGASVVSVNKKATDLAINAANIVGPKKTKKKKS